MIKFGVQFHNERSPFTNRERKRGGIPDVYDGRTLFFPQNVPDFKSRFP